MATTSNAFHFSSFMQSSVDPRTGLFTQSIALPPLNANDLCGPDYPGQLDFNPMNSTNAGFGIGWNLKNSRFNSLTGMLDLYTGETFKVHDNGPGEKPVIPEVKLESFHFQNISKDNRKRYRIAHKSGLIEILEPQRSNPDIAITARVTNASGHGIRFMYDTEKDHPRLTSITDDTGRSLLEIDYSLTDQVSITSNPKTPDSARYTLKLDSEQLRKIILPTSTDEYWDVNYQSHEQGTGNEKVTLYFINRIKNPDGGVETIRYKGDGHKYPGIERTLPCVEEHVVMPDRLDTSTHMRTRYRFSSNNFLGNNTGLIYGDDGTDQLYRYANSHYEYTSTAEHYLGSAIQRTVVSTFNRFHLMTLQTTTEQGCIETISTKYHEKENTQFGDQPAYFQLPHKVIKSWRQAGSSEPGDSEETTTLYDNYGNLLTEIKPDGSRMERTYYPGTEDPEGFVRNLMTATIYPASTDNPEAPKAQVVSNLYKYIELPAIPQANIAPDLPNLPNWLALQQEDMYEGPVEDGRLLNSKKRHYLNKPDLPFLHGRLDKQVLEINDTKAVSSWKYEKVKADDGTLSWGQNTETFTDYTGTLQRKTTSTFALHTGQLVLEQDANGVFTRYRHDLLGRVIGQTASPGTSFAATHTTVYKFLEDDGKIRAAEEITDNKGVITRIVYDGNRRPIKEQRTAKHPLSGNPITRTVSQMRYDSAGRLASETSFDYLPANDGSQAERVLQLVNRYAYDGWGQRSDVIRPDGVRERVDTSPLEAGGRLVTRWIESPKLPGKRLQLHISKLNRFGKPVYEYRQVEEKDRPVLQVGRTDYTYDGLGRCLSETETIRDPVDSSRVITRTNQFRYDALGRMFSNQRPNGATLLREFASHSVGELVTRLELKVAGSNTGQILYQRNFDGLDRLVRLAVGSREECYTYRGTTQLVETRTAYKLEMTGKGKCKHIIRYDYEPELTEQPKKLTATVEEQGQLLSTENADFEYDVSSADINTASNALGVRSYIYTDQGDLAEEHWQEHGGMPYSTFYQQSWQGRPLQRKYSDGLPCNYEYDDLGRISSVVQGPLKSTLAYNDIGLLKSTETRDTTNPIPEQQPVALCNQYYDTLGREISRTLSVNGQEQTFTQVWQDDDMLHSRTLERGGRRVRHETFQYDELGRLTKYDCPEDTARTVANGRQIKTQIFSFDDVDNIKRCRTTFIDGQRDDANFTYASHDIYQLDKVTHTLPPEGCPAEQSFGYDALGNMLNDECGNKLYYDTFGRLQQVLDAAGTLKARYGYDGHDQLVYSSNDNSRQQRRYLGYEMDSVLEDGLLTQYLHTGGQPRAEFQLDVAEQNAVGPVTFLLTDHTGSVICESEEQTTRYACYAPYGEQLPEDSAQELRSLLAFNGEARERALGWLGWLGWYLLGLGYRAYNPRLMRFHSPDSLPPEETGINPYSYALGNPVYWQDPTGHRGQPVTHGREAPLEIISDDKPKIPWYVWLGVAATAAIFVVSAIAMPWTAPATLGITAGYVAGVVGVASNGVAAVLQGVGTAKRIENPELSDALFHISTVFSVIGMYAGGYGSASTRAAVKAVKSAKSVSSSAVNVATKVKVINNPVKIFKFKPRTSVRDVKFTSATQTTAPGSPTTTATPTPTSSPTPTSGLVSDGPSTSAALSAENATKAAARTATRAPAPPRIFKLDLTTLDNQAGNILQKTDDGSFISAPPKR